MSSEGNAVATPDLKALEATITKLGEEIKRLKSASEAPDKGAVESLVKQLLDAKRTYAEHNHGIGVDGKPFEEPLSKAEQKKRDKAAKSAAAAGGEKGTATAVNVENAAKKAAKKAEKSVKKAAHKSGDAVEVAKTEEVTKSAVPVTKAAVVPLLPTTALGAMEVAFSPNVPLVQRPLLTLAVASILNVAPDLTLKSDHKRWNPAMGTKQGTDIVGDAAMARYLLQAIPNHVLVGGSCPVLQAQVSAWVDYAHAMMYRLNKADTSAELALTTTLERALASRTFLVGSALTLADLAMYQCLGWTCTSRSAASRWSAMLYTHPAVREATSLAQNVAGNNEVTFATHESMDELVQGMNYLENGRIGNVCTRFPPEPSGYLHIGHAKACLLNDYYATRYKGRLIVRFDDTNPSKEKEEYQTSILQDLKRLGIKPTMVTFTSDYFETIRGYALQLIQDNLAFMDDTPQEQMQAERMELKPSKHRDQTVQETLKYFDLMCSGSQEGSTWCLRAKIDVASVNGTMRDPVIYRQNLTPHHNSGTTYKAYPTYDLACPIVDSIEGVSHALRTTEYNDRDEQYAWFQHALRIRRNRIHAFARMNFMYTELSKRKLAWFVDQGLVEGWNDPRFPTVQGVIRRGVNMTALRKFILSQGASRRVVNMDWAKFWAENKKEIDLSAKRFMAIDATDHVILRVTNAPLAQDYAYTMTDYLPKDPSFGNRCVRLASEVLLETTDTQGMTVGETIVLMRWGVVKLTKVSGTHLEGEYVPDGDIKASKRKITWLAHVKENIKVTVYEFDNLISKEKIGEDDDFKDYVNPHTKAESCVLGDAGLRNLQQHEVIQLERRGYFRVDRPHLNDSTKPLVLFMIPDGKTKSMGGLTGKLAHH